MTIALSSPKLNGIERGPAARFIWAPEPSPSENYVLEIANDSGFTSMVSRIDTPRHDINVVIPPGSYYWRVTYMGDNPSGRAFSVEEMTPEQVTTHIEDGVSRILSQFKETE